MTNVVISKDGTKEWRLNGKLHRVDGPAYEDANGHKEWYLNDKRHREDGPAIEYAGGTKEWYLNGTEYSFSIWLEKTLITENEKIMLCLKY